MTTVKVKDAVNIWLFLWSGASSTTYPGIFHYFADKKQSVCGKARHPKTQPQAIMVCGRCKLCERKVQKHVRVARHN